MEAHELFIGAWVMRGDIVAEPMKVTEIIPYKDYVCMDFTGLAVAAKFSQINPIPLTPEILEENGFVQDNAIADSFGFEIFGIDNLLCGLSYGEEIDTWIFETFKPWTHTDYDGAPVDWGYDTRAIIPDIRYVHELQHALKCCKIDKEIVL